MSPGSIAAGSEVIAGCGRRVRQEAVGDCGRRSAYLWRPEPGSQWRRGPMRFDRFDEGAVITLEATERDWMIQRRVVDADRDHDILGDDGIERALQQFGGTCSPSASGLCCTTPEV